ncbi:MAG: ABC transporter substrate binding protein [Gammaproteobacteria bacterium]
MTVVMPQQGGPAAMGKYSIDLSFHQQVGMRCRVPEFPGGKRVKVSACVALWQWLLGVSLLVLGFCQPALAASCVAVLYPEMREPYREVFSQITDGISAYSRLPAVTYVLQDDSSTSSLRGWLDKQQCAATIALGRRAVDAAAGLDRRAPLIVGAVLTTPGTGTQGVTGISLVPDPELMLRRLREMAPAVRRVTVIYNPKDNAWLVAQAQTAAQRHGLILDALPAADLRAAARLYREALRSNEARDKALWLPTDPTTVDENLILPMVLEGAWNQNIVVFSSNPIHVKRGVLFALYPDNAALGRSLAALAAQQAQRAPDRSQAVAPLRDFLIAVNLRTAAHLGLEYSTEQLSGFHLVFPSQ